MGVVAALRAMPPVRCHNFFMIIILGIPSCSVINASWYSQYHAYWEYHIYRDIYDIPIYHIYRNIYDIWDIYSHIPIYHMYRKILYYIVNSYKLHRKGSIFILGGGVGNISASLQDFGSFCLQMALVGHHKGEKKGYLPVWDSSLQEDIYTELVLLLLNYRFTMF